MAEVPLAKRKEAFRMRLQGKSFAAIVRELHISRVTLGRLERGWVDRKGVRHKGWREELERLWNEDGKADLQCAIAIREKRVQTYDRLMRQAVEAIEKNFPNIVLKNASDVKALLSEVRELCRLASIELGQYHPGGGTLVAVKNEITLADVQEAYTVAQEVKVEEIPPPREAHYDEPDRVEGDAAAGGDAEVALDG